MKCLSFIVLLIIFLKGHCVEQYCKINDAEHCKERDEGYKYKKGIYFFFTCVFCTKIKNYSLMHIEGT